MALRQIHISNQKSRNSLISFKGITPVSKTKKVDKDFQEIKNYKIIKGTSDNSFEALQKKYEDNLDLLAEDLISTDPEIDIEVVGKFLTPTPRVYINENMKVVYRVNKTEKVFNPKGELMEERKLRQLDSNITTDIPLKWSGKYFPIEKAYNKFVFIRTYQLFHDSGLTYDFLFEMAKELEEKKSFLLLGSGSKGVGPAIFQENGTPYRIFLEGRTKGEEFMLLMHLSNLEYKTIQK